MADHTDYYLDPDLEKMYHKDLSKLDLHDHDSDSNDVLSAHLPEWLIGVIIVIIMLIVAFFVMAITTLIKKRKKNQSSLQGDTVSSAVACDDLESGKIGQGGDRNSKSMILPGDLKPEQEDGSCLPEKDFTSTSHRALGEVSNQAGCSCRNPLFVDDEEQEPKENQQNHEDRTTANEDVLTTVLGDNDCENATSKGSPHKHKTTKVNSPVTDSRSLHSSSNISPSVNNKRRESESSLSGTKPSHTRSPSSCRPGDALSERDEVFDDSNNESCHSLSSGTEGRPTGEDEKDAGSHIASPSSGVKRAHESQTPYENAPDANCDVTDITLDSLEIMEAACNHIIDEEEDIEKDTGIISTSSRDKHVIHLQKSSSSDADDKIWHACNGHSPQNIEFNSLVKTRDDTSESQGYEKNANEQPIRPNGMPAVNEPLAAITVGSQLHENYVNETFDRLSTNL